MSDENEGMIASLTKTIENNWRLLLVGVIILAIALNSSWSNKKSSAGNSATPTPQTEQSNQADQNKPQETTQAANNNTSDTAQTKTPEVTTTSTNTNTIAEVAAKSEGVTHLARKAIKEYLSTATENLSAEQKIYAEDYLRKKTGTKVLEIGEKIEFSTDLVKQSVEQAKGLSQKQIENLSKYVPLVNLN